MATRKRNSVHQSSQQLSTRPTCSTPQSHFHPHLSVRKYMRINKARTTHTHTHTHRHTQTQTQTHTQTQSERERERGSERVLELSNISASAPVDVTFRVTSTPTLSNLCLFRAGALSCQR